MTGHQPSRVVLAWRAGEVDMLVHDLIDIVGGGTRTPASVRRAR
ncbi:hypothetical protein ACWDWU_15900 [Streptomyces sp. NPDC003442]